MKTHYILAMVFLLFTASSTFSQTSGTTNSDANRKWQSFWRQVTAAINHKDGVALRKMMTNNLSDDIGGLTADEWLRFIDKNNRRGSWRDLQKSFARGMVVNKNWSSKGIPTRVTRDNKYYFEFRKDKRWYFAGVVGD